MGIDCLTLNKSFGTDRYLKRSFIYTRIQYAVIQIQKRDHSQVMTNCIIIIIQIKQNFQVLLVKLHKYLTSFKHTSNVKKYKCILYNTNTSQVLLLQILCVKWVHM